MNKWRSIGILGGLGPRASAHFLRLLLDICSSDYGAVQDYEYPQIFFVNVACDAFDNIGKTNEAALTRDVRAAVDLLDNLGAALIVIPCNSIYVHLQHVIPWELRASVPILPEYVAEAASKLNARNAIVLSGLSIRETRYYDAFFHSRGIDPVYPDQLTQATVERFIFEVMANSFSEQTEREFASLIESLLDRHDVVVVACSELSVLLGNSSPPGRVIDDMWVLAKQALKLARINS